MVNPNNRRPYCDLIFCFAFQLMGDEPDLDPDISKSFFEGNVLKLDPSLLTENGIRLVIRTNSFT